MDGFILLLPSGLSIDIYSSTTSILLTEYEDAPVAKGRDSSGIISNNNIRRRGARRLGIGDDRMFGRDMMMIDHGDSRHRWNAVASLEWGLGVRIRVSRGGGLLLSFNNNNNDNLLLLGIHPSTTIPDKTISIQIRLPAELKHISKRRKRN